jgi:hypothetical protein
MSEIFFKNLWATFRTTIITFFLLTFCALPVFPAEKDIKEQLLSEGGYQKIDDILQKRQVFTGSQDFTINKFHSDITINEDSSFTVKEAIHVEFHRQRHLRGFTRNHLNGMYHLEDSELSARIVSLIL